MKNILMAYHGSAFACRALETAADLALAMGAKLTIVSVVPEEFGLPILMDPFDSLRHHRDRLTGPRTTGRLVLGSVSAHSATRSKVTVVIVH